MNKKVVIVQRRLTHYRAPLFELLRNELGSRRTRLELLVGRGTPLEEERHDSVKLEWSTQIPTYYFAGNRICWQPFFSHLEDADLVIVAQENALLANHLMVISPRKFRLAFWGHGANLQSANPRGLKERYKRWTTNQVDWWFCYTQLSAKLVTAAGFLGHRITVLNNAVDTSELIRQRLSISAEELLALRQSLQFGEGPVGVFVGSLHKNKRLEFLFEAVDALHREVDGFQLLILGDGPERNRVQEWCRARPWAHWAGARFGREKAGYLSLADVMLNPGLVGLGIIDSFVCGVPMVTTDWKGHSPEIAYLENGRNAIMAGNDLRHYVDVVKRLLREPRGLSVLQAGCAVSAAEYTLENMVGRFAEGIENALGPPSS
ncbi:glycosyltransferase family 4 protein [Thiocapsa bogorovii]|uniref:glycosyltransferase family 4 protein n=1 Tax=Thiocapsa bogorovii TaxID=521689 RepID=UPI001E2CD6F1|nr:glycosyltransferase family 4 protein [Thiocapsa bogorovii]UHD16247.1 glycosyltransferase family 4 protein [Thiocapsa bogorovii]